MRTVINSLSVMLLTFFILGCSGGDMPLTPAPGPSPELYLGGGHPIEGVNYARNNRSPYNLPTSFEYWEVYRDLFKRPEHWGNVIFHDLLIDADEKLYISRYDETYLQFNDGAGEIDEYKLYSFIFGENHGDEFEGGFNMALTENGIYSVGNYYYSENHWASGNYAFKKWKSDVRKYSPWPNMRYEVSTHWGDETWWGEDQGKRVFDLIFPLPDGSLLVSCSKIDDVAYKPGYLQRLSPDLEVVMYELPLQGDITGIALDVNNGNIYIATAWQVAWLMYSHLYCLTPNLDIIWDTKVTMAKFGAELPVIDDDSGILGLVNGRLKRITSDGSPAGDSHCQARQRPALFNDGTIVVLCESGILYFDYDLNETGAIPLPTGPGTGSEYTCPPLVDAVDNFAIFHGPDLWTISRQGVVLTHRTFESDIREIRLGPEHLFVALDNAIYRFPS